MTHSNDSAQLVQICTRCAEWRLAGRLEVGPDLVGTAPQKRYRLATAADVA